ncbi:hypothetical protein NXV86_06050 [Bacteroides sp. BFG-257]|uniref:hypothetical protein n=1 Tax=Bacteroides sp. BFG-257 TaxID=2972761 RepID=UPI0021629DB2|nr:hypothetical protein [Bacteroides sp. BFG-257]UVO99560.1 hypothetical protein NXV86_06050 [Bacteroides sp. BFG-257]
METNMIIVKKELLNKLLSKNYLDEADWEELEGSVNLLQNNFTCKLCQNFPILSRDDIHIILLIYVGMKNVEIARLLHILPRSFRMRRCRLKKENENRL